MNRGLACHEKNGKASILPVRKLSTWQGQLGQTNCELGFSMRTFSHEFFVCWEMSQALFEMNPHRRSMMWDSLSMTAKSENDSKCQWFLIESQMSVLLNWFGLHLHPQLQHIDHKCICHQFQVIKSWDSSWGIHDQWWVGDVETQVIRISQWWIQLLATRFISASQSVVAVTDKWSSGPSNRSRANKLF